MTAKVNPLWGRTPTVPAPPKAGQRHPARARDEGKVSPHGGHPFGCASRRQATGRLNTVHY